MNMDMAMTGTPWLDTPVMLHSSRAATCTLTPEQCAYRNGHWRYWYEADHVYALNTVYFFVAAIGLCILGYWSFRLAPARLQRTTGWQKVVSAVRFLAYRHFEVKPLGRHLPSLGVSILLGAGFLFFTLMTLGPQPYYWPNTATVSYGSSPPLATRAGWMAVACFPFLLVLPTKTNLIAKLTGVSHERLIVFHNWVGWAMFVLALVHTFPFIVYHINKGDMVEEWNTSLAYWTGVVALLAEAYLQVFSLPWIRNRFYEFFKATHFFVALIFVIFFFFHCDFRLTSWDYFIAAGVLYAFCAVGSQMRTYFEYGLQSAKLEMVSDHALKITVPLAGNEWRPGQHMFLRFATPHLGPHHMLTAHPFSICSMPSRVASGQLSKLVFYVKPRGGLTGRLVQAAAQKPGQTLPVLLDGPYGGIKGRPLCEYDHSVVVTCGSGASLSLPFVMEALLHAARGPALAEDQKKASGGHPRLRVVIATRDERLVQWYREALLEFLDENRLDSLADAAVEVCVYQNGSPGTSIRSSSDEERAAGEQKPHASSSVAGAQRVPLRLFSGRPDVAGLVKEATLLPDASVGIVVCGPAEVVKATQREAAAAQLRIVGAKPGAREVSLHSEAFSW